MARHAQITQNNKFAISLQYLKKEVIDEVDFLHANKHESLLQIDTMILMEMLKHSQKSQNSKFAISLQYLRKTLEIKLIFCMQINIRDSYKLIQYFGHKVSNKKEVWNGVHLLHADKHQSFYNLVLSFLMEVARHVQSTQNRKLLIFLQYMKKKVLQLLLCCCDAKHSDIQGSSQVRCYLLHLI